MFCVYIETTTIMMMMMMIASWVAVNCIGRVTVIVEGQTYFAEREDQVEGPLATTVCAASPDSAHRKVGGYVVYSVFVSLCLYLFFFFLSLSLFVCLYLSRSVSLLP